MVVNLEWLIFAFLQIFTQSLRLKKAKFIPLTVEVI